MIPTHIKSGINQKRDQRGLQEDKSISPNDLGKCMDISTLIYTQPVCFLGKWDVRGRE